VLLAPPFVIEEQHRGELVDKLSGALDRALAEITD
jgi:adenosylmethionine-8-amino-7-oxononanoate aminotransferase